ncbi:hypothetical protein ACU4GD_35405 [Cupriavidus basilensis]
MDRFSGAAACSVVKRTSGLEALGLALHLRSAQYTTLFDLLAGFSPRRLCRPV